MNEVMSEPTGTESVGAETTAIDIETASDEALSNFLEDAQGAEETVAASESEVPTQEVEEEAQSASEPKADTKKPEDEPKAEDVKLSRKEWEELQAKFDKQQRQIKQQEDFIQRRNTELGGLRKQLREQAEALDERLADEDFRDDPVAVAKAVAMRERIDQQVEQVEREERGNILHLETMRQLQQELKPDEGIGVEAFVESLRRMGVNDQQLQAFQTNPIGWVGNPVAFRFLAGKVRAEHYAGKLYEYAKQLQSENAKLKEKAASAATQTATNISRALKTPAPMTATAPTRTSQGRFAANPASMSESEIEAFLQRAKK